MSKNRKRLHKRFVGLRWLHPAYFCDKNAKALTVAEIANPNCDPWLTTLAFKSVDSGQSYYQFLYRPSTGKLKFRAVNGPHSLAAGPSDNPFIRIKRSRKAYKQIVSELEKLEPKIKPSILLGRQGTSILSTGYVFAPYIPILSTPTNFGISSRGTGAIAQHIIKKYSKVFLSPKYYGTVSVTNL